MSIKILAVIILYSILPGCFQVPLTSSAKLESDQASNQTLQVYSTSLGDNKQVAAIDPNSKESTQLTTPTVASLAGASVVVSPGSLGIAVDLVVEQASDFGETSIASEMGLAGDIQVAATSSGMIIRPSENVDLKKPLALAMPLPVSFGFRLAAGSGSKYGIFYKYFDPTEQHLVTGLKIVDGVNVKLSFDEASGRDTIKFEGYFGAYWAAQLSREVTVAELPPPKAADEPIINKAKVAVYNTTGVVKETEVVAKQAVPELVWAKPSIKLNTETRTLVTSVAVPAGHTVQGCKVDLFEAATQKSGISLDVPLGPTAEYAIVKKEEHSLVSRFRCTDEQGRISVTPWSESIKVPALQIVAAADYNPGVCDATNQPNLFAGSVDTTGQLYIFDTIAAAGQCKYSADVYVQGGGNFFIMRNDQSFVCGLATHTLTEGSATTLTCQRATAAGVGNDYLVLPPGNYHIALDFSKALLKPTLTLNFLPCDRGAMFVKFDSNTTAPTFTNSSIIFPMKHLGACEFVYEAPTIPVATHASVSIRNSDNTFSCGDSSGNAPGTYEYSDQTYFENSCGTGNRYFNLAEGEHAPLYRFRLRLGEAAHHQNSSNTNSILEFLKSSNCPDQLFMYSTALGTTPDYSKNYAYRQGVCKYVFPVLADLATAHVYDFKISSLNGGIVCGGTSSGNGTFTPQCGSNPPQVPFLEPLDKSYNVTLIGNGISGSFANAIGSITKQQNYCDGGMYLQNSVTAGFRNIAAKAFQEVKECLFEKIWTPTSSNDGFYLSTAGSQICGNYSNPTDQPSTTGSQSSMYCQYGLSNATQLSQIKPLNLIAGTAYKITVDERSNTYGGKISIVPRPTPKVCAEDLYLIGRDMIATTPNSTNQFTNLGDCTYTFDLNATANETFSYIIKNASSTHFVTLNTAIPVLNSNTGSRSEIVTYSSGETGDLTLQVYPNSVYRFILKLDALGTKSTLTLQGLSNYSFMNFRLAGAGTDATPTASKTFQQSYQGITSYSTALWSASGGTGFVLTNSEIYNPYFCGLAAGGPTPALGVEMNVICNYAAVSAAPEFGTWSAGQYLITYKPGRTWEDYSTVAVNTYHGFSSPITMAQVTGTHTIYSSATQPTGSTTTPEAYSGASTWTDDDGSLWMFGGSYYNTTLGEILSNNLWRFDPSSKTWTLIVSTPSEINGNPTGTTPHPGSRANAMQWFDSTNDRLYLLGGKGYDNFGDYCALTDLWYFQLPSNGWHFVKGSGHCGDTVDYGSQGIGAASNNPPPRLFAATWVDGDGNFWFFGGADNNSYNRYADLWKLTLTSTPFWTWENGPSGAGNYSGSAGAYPSSRYNSAVWFADDRVYIYGGYAGNNNASDLWSLDLRTNQSPDTYQLWTELRPSGANGSGIGRPATFGPTNRPGYYSTLGGNWTSANGDLWLYDGYYYWAYRPSIDQWATLGRGTDPSTYYNYQHTPVYASSGLDTNNWHGNRSGSMVWTNSSGFWLFGGYANDNTLSGTRDDLWQIQVPTN